MHIEKITRLRESRTQAVFRKVLVRGTALSLVEKEVSMSLKYGHFLSQVFALEPAGIKDPVEAYETLTRWAQTADQSGYDSVWIPDHFLTTPPSQAMVFECWTLAAALARDTKRVRIGQTELYCIFMKGLSHE